MTAKELGSEVVVGLSRAKETPEKKVVGQALWESSQVREAPPQQQMFWTPCSRHWPFHQAEVLGHHRNWCLHQRRCVAQGEQLHHSGNKSSQDHGFEYAVSSNTRHCWPNVHYQFCRRIDRLDRIVARKAHISASNRHILLSFLGMTHMLARSCGGGAYLAW
jgi:hypothetical protein